MSFLKRFRRFQAPQQNPKHAAVISEPATPVEEYTMDIRIRLSNKVFYEVPSQFAAILLAGLPERFEQVQVVKQQPLTHSWGLGTSHYGGQKFLVLTTPIGEAVRYNGNPEEAHQHFIADY